MAESPVEKQPLIPGWAKRVIPILVSVLILYYYFHDRNWHELLDATRQARLWLALLAAATPQLVMWFTTVLLTEWTMVWFHGPFSFWKYFWVRGAIFILQMINNPLAAGGSLLYIQRKTGIGWARLLGIMGFRFQLAIWGFSVLMIPATLAMHYYGMTEAVKINMRIWWAFLISQVIFLIGSWIFWHHKLDITLLGKVVVRDRESEFWRAFNMATPKEWLLTWAVILPQILIALVSYYFLARAFEVNVPFWECLVVMPLVLMIANLPIAFGGFGTTTVAWFAFFGDYGSEENIAALTLFIPTARAVIRAVIGLVSLQPAFRDLTTLSLLSPNGADEVADAAMETKEP